MEEDSLSRSSQHNEEAEDEGEGSNGLANRDDDDEAGGGGGPCDDEGGDKGERHAACQQSQQKGTVDNKGDDEEDEEEDPGYDTPSTEEETVTARVGDHTSSKREKQSTIRETAADESVSFFAVWWAACNFYVDPLLPYNTHFFLSTSLFS